MKFYKDKNNEIFAYNLDGSQDHLIGTKVSITKEEADALIKQATQNQLILLSYAEKRRIEYPSIGDQLDSLYHSGVFSDEMTATIKAVKDKYPKN